MRKAIFVSAFTAIPTRRYIPRSFTIFAVAVQALFEKRGYPHHNRIGVGNGRINV